MHYYIGEKVKSEKMNHIVGYSFLRFLEGLERPMKLNEMRNMKEPNYSKVRGILRDPRLFGDTVMKSIAEKCDEVGINKNAYHMIFEGFWDLYFKKPATGDLSSKKLEGWFNRINMKVPPNGPPDGEEIDPEVPLDTGLPVKAVVRVRIPFKRPEVVEGEEVD